MMRLTIGPAFAWLLALRFVLVNVFAVAFVLSAWAMGHIEAIWLADKSRLTSVIVLAFLVGLWFACRAAWRISVELNDARRGDLVFPDMDDLRERLSHRIAIVRQTANTLVFLGLIGTVVGFILALSGVKPDSAGDVSAIAPMVAALIEGMAVALFTTLVGSVLALWLTVLHRMLQTACHKLIRAARKNGHA
ncbi:MAG: MotA/TolQ/ExbB proton channel family protein [Gemmatimonadaceae bacterium]|nr:MotA/TolQ/ExbB proton channel family protein [Gemmatimonadaceae bacterium]